MAGTNKGSEECPMPPAQGEQVLELTGALGNGGLSSLGSDPPARWPQHCTPDSVCKWQSTKQADAEHIKTKTLAVAT